MSNERTKQEELWFGRMFAELLGEFSPDDIIASESPDLLVRVEGGLIGLELTRLTQSDKLAQQTGEREKVVREALRVYETSSEVPLQVFVYTDVNARFSRVDRNPLAKCLAKLVLDNIPEGGARRTLTNDWRGSPEFPRQFRAIDIFRAKSLTRNSWDAPTSGMVRENCVDDIKAAVEQKECRLPNYAPECIAHWLLLVIKNDSAATFFDPSAEAISYRYATSFERVFLLNSFPRELWELSTEKLS